MKVKRKISTLTPNMHIQVFNLNMSAKQTNAVSALLKIMCMCVCFNHHTMVAVPFNVSS